MKSPENSHAGQQRLHIVYFVDSGSTRSLTIRLSHIKGVLALLSGLILFALAAALLSLVLFGELKVSRAQVRQLKSAVLADAIVNDNLLKEAPVLLAGGSNLILNPRSAEVAKALLNGKPVAPTIDGASDAEPKDESTSGDGIRNTRLETAVPKVASSFPQVPAPDQTRSPRNETSVTLVSEGTPQAPINDKAAATSAPSPVLAAGTDKDGSAPKTSAVSFANIRTNFNQDTQKLTLRFDMRKESVDEQQVEGRFCAVLTGRDQSGKVVTLVYPPQSKFRKDNSIHCQRGFPVRLARLRPSSIDFSTAPLKLESARFTFVSRGQSIQQDHSFFK